MKLILIDGGPASGKNTLGALLVKKLHKDENRVILLDLDTYVEKINPTWIWENKKTEKSDQLGARKDFIEDIQQLLQGNYTVIAIGERFLTKNDVVIFTRRLNIHCHIELFHLSSPLAIRRKRLHERGPHSLINLEKDQKERGMVTVWPGYVYRNINSPHVDANNLMKLIQDMKGTIVLA